MDGNWTGSPQGRNILPVTSGGSSIGRTRRTPPPPLFGENIAFSSIFWNKVKLAILFQPKCGLRPLLLHILDPPLVTLFYIVH